MLHLPSQRRASAHEKARHGAGLGGGMEWGSRRFRAEEIASVYEVPVDQINFDLLSGAFFVREYVPQADEAFEPVHLLDPE